MRIRVTSADARALAIIAEGLRASARAHKQAVRAHRDALRIVMQALETLDEYTNGEAGEQHGRTTPRDNDDK